MDIRKKLEKYLKFNLSENNKKENKAIPVRKSVMLGSKNVEAACMDYESARENIDINAYIEEHKEESTFQTRLFSYIDARDKKDSDIYNKVNMDRRLFSKIRGDKNYHPSKETVILLGIALELEENELEKLLESASYALPLNTTFDLIIRFCFKEKIYNLNQINEFLYEHDCKVLNGNKIAV